MQFILTCPLGILSIKILMHHHDSVDTPHLLPESLLVPKHECHLLLLASVHPAGMVIPQQLPNNITTVRYSIG